METERYLTPDEAAAYLRVCRTTVYRLARAGQIPAVRVGGQWRFHKRDLYVWLRAKPTPPSDASR